MKRPYKLYRGDCLDVMDQLISKQIKVDAIITDPPYNISKKSGYTNNSKDKINYIKKYGKHKIDFGEWDQKAINLDLFFEKSYDLLKNGGTLLFFYDIWKLGEVKEYLNYHKGFKQLRLGCWIKNNPVPINSKINYLSNAKEYFFTVVKKSKPTFNSKFHNGDFNYNTCKGKERTLHPTQKPLNLIEELVKIHSNENDLILDPFMGSATTGVACINLNRKFIGIELDKKYFKIARKRVKDSKKVKKERLF